MKRRQGHMKKSRAHRESWPAIRDDHKAKPWLVFQDGGHALNTKRKTPGTQFPNAWKLLRCAPCLAQADDNADTEQAEDAEEGAWYETEPHESEAFEGGSLPKTIKGRAPMKQRKKQQRRAAALQAPVSEHEALEAELKTETAWPEELDTETAWPEELETETALTE